MSDLQAIHEAYEALTELAKKKLASNEKGFQSFLENRNFTKEEAEAAGYGRMLGASDCQHFVNIMLDDMGFDAFFGVPGFYREEGQWRLRNVSGHTIPVRDRVGKIRSIKYRTSLDDAKYQTLSSPPNATKAKGQKQSFPNGTASTTYPHWPILKNETHLKGHLRITEGEFKADMASSRTPIYTISIPGVRTWKSALDEIKAMPEKPTHIYLAFDADKDSGTKDDPAIPNDIARSLAELYFTLSQDYTVIIEHWPLASGKGIDDLIVGDRQGEIEMIEGHDADALCRRYMGSDLPEHWVYCIEDEKFYEQGKKKGFKASQFNAAHAETHKMGKDFATRCIDNPAFIKAKDKEYDPRKPRIFKNDKGESVLNTHIAKRVEPVEGDCSIYTDHLEWLIGEKDAEHVLDFMAYCVQHPGEKIHHAILIHSITQGNGKSMIASPMDHIIGEENISKATKKEIGGEYSAWQYEAQFVVVNELEDASPEFVADLKERLTEPMARVRIMHQDAFSIPNVYNMMMFSNSSKAVKVSRTDRRFFISHATEGKQDQAYYDKLGAWIKDNAGALKHFFLNRDLSNFSPKSAPPRNKAFEDMYYMSMTDQERWIDSGIRNATQPFDRDVCSPSIICHHLPGDISGKFGRFTPDAIMSILSGYGSMTPEIDLQRLSERCVVVRNHNKWLSEKVTAKALVKEALKPEQDSAWLSASHDTV